MDDIKKQIGKQIKLFRTNLRLTQEELAKKLGLNSKTIIANYESGYSTPNDEIKLKMIEIFNCSLEDLFGVSSHNEVTPLEIAASTKNHVDLSEISDRDKEIIMNIINTSKKDNN